MKLLLAEDDAMIGASLSAALRQAGFAADWVRDGKEADLALQEGGYDLLLLDLGLPRRDGLDVLRQLRARGDTTPVLIVTARDAVSERVNGLNLGADDYLTKPFNLDELIARVHALTRRAHGRGQSELLAGALRLNPLNKLAELAGKPLHLSHREFSLLTCLMETPGAVLSKEQLESRVYGWGEEVASNAIEVHLHHLRRKLGAAWIRNVRGVGYRLAPPDDA